MMSVRHITLALMAVAPFAPLLAAVLILLG